MRSPTRSGSIGCCIGSKTRSRGADSAGLLCSCGGARIDSFPTDPKEQLSLVRFRMKRSVPFDVESAVVGFHAQGRKGKGTDVVVVAAALEIMARYEAPFRAAAWTSPRICDHVGNRNDRSGAWAGHLGDGAPQRPRFDRHRLACGNTKTRSGPWNSVTRRTRNSRESCCRRWRLWKIS